MADPTRAINLLLVILLAAVHVLAGDAEENPAPSAAPTIAEKITLSGGLSGDLRWLEDPLLGPSPTTDLYLRRVEVGIEASLADWASAIVVANSEWIGDPLQPGAATPGFDEAHVDLKIPKTPLYAVAGLRTQPFGQFEGSMVTDPLTQDAYETKTPGVTLGVTGLLGLDASLTLYRGDELMAHLFSSGLFDATAVVRPGAGAGDAHSMVAALSAAPFSDALHMGAAYSSEPGGDRRNETLDLFVSLNPSSLKSLTVDAEWMRALRRETYVRQELPFREGAFSLELSWVFDTTSSLSQSHRGRGSYLGRRSRRRAYPVAAMLRFESFSDDGLAAAYGTWSVRDRLATGVHFTASHSGSLLVYAAAQYCRETRRNSRPSDAVYFRLGLDF